MLPRVRKLALASLFLSYFLVAHILAPEVSYVILSAIWLFLGWKYVAILFTYLVVEAVVRMFSLFDWDLILWTYNVTGMIYETFPEPLRTPLLYQLDIDFHSIKPIYLIQLLPIAAIIILIKIVIYRFILLRLLPKEIMKV